MLALLVSLLLASNIIRVQSQSACRMQGQTPLRDSGTHNFVIDSFEGNNFPFAIEQCTATSLNATNWYKYFCSYDALGAWIVTKKEYSDAQCSGDGTLVLDWDTQFNALQKYYECDGSNTYLQLELSVGGCQNPITIYAGLAACIHDTDEDEANDFELYCNDTTALVHYFGSFDNETLMSTTGMAMQSTTTSLPSSTINIMLSSTSNEASTTEMELNMSTTNFELNMSSTDLEMNFSTTEMLELNMSTNIPMSTSFMPSLISTNFPMSTKILSTLLSSFMPSFSTSMEYMCDDNEYCDVWVLPKDTCVVAKPSSFKSNQIYAKMKQCGVSQGQQTTGATQQQEKAGSIHSPLAISGILSLLFAVYWF